MARVLIPFSDLASGERAVRQLLGRRHDPRLAVELLSIVDPLTPGKVGIFVSPERARAQATDAASRGLRDLERVLDDARIPHRSQVAIGRVREILRREGARRGVDEVLLGTGRHDPLQRWRRRFVAHAMDRPLVTVS